MVVVPTANASTATAIPVELAFFWPSTLTTTVCALLVRPVKGTENEALLAAYRSKVLFAEPSIVTLALP